MHPLVLTVGVDDMVTGVGYFDIVRYLVVSEVGDGQELWN